jgi:hypothetical protein
MLTGQSMTLSVSAFDSATPPNPVPLPAGSTVSYQSSVPSFVTVTPNADGVTAVAKAVAVGPVDSVCTIEGILTFQDGSGRKQFATPLLNVTVTFPVSAIAAVAMAETTPA